MNNKNNSKNIEFKNNSMGNVEKLKIKKKYLNLIKYLLKINFYIFIGVLLFIYKKPIENNLLEKDNEIEYIKNQLNSVLLEKKKLIEKIQRQNTTIQNQIYLLKNQYSKYEQDIISNKNINAELKEQIEFYQKNIEIQKELFQNKTNSFEKDIKYFKNIIEKYRKEMDKELKQIKNNKNENNKISNSVYNNTINGKNDLTNKENNFLVDSQKKPKGDSFKYSFKIHDLIFDKNECLSETILFNYYVKLFFENICPNENYLYSKKNINIINKPSMELYNKKLFYHLVDKEGLNKAYLHLTDTSKTVIVLNFWSGYNYGAVLTGYAIQTILLKLGYYPYLIRRDNVRSKKSIWWQFQNDNIFSSEEVFNLDQLKKLNKYYDNFIVGSDQVWRYKYSKRTYKKFFLSFVDKNKNKIACAASFGQNYYDGPKNVTNEVTNYIKNFNSISVREKSGVDICKNVFGVEAKAIFDPIFYLKRNDWNKILDKSNINLSSHGFVYVLDNSKILNNQIDNILNKMKIPKYLFKIGKSSVYDFVKSIQSSKKVITDSFHGLCFSIIFHKDFVCLCNKSRGEDRFISLLSDLGLMDRLFYNLDDVQWEKLSPINYIKVEKIIEEKRKEGIDYLLSNLEK